MIISFQTRACARWTRELIGFLETVIGSLILASRDPKEVESKLARASPSPLE
jgi:hypothetical protein